nr:7449_t:CDS:2 [Entrophospora candida]
MISNIKNYFVLKTYQSDITTCPTIEIYDGILVSSLIVASLTLFLYTAFTQFHEQGVYVAATKEMNE